MNRLIQEQVIAPPIPKFKSLAAEVKPKCAERFDMTQAVPSFPTFGKIREGLALDLQDMGTSFYTDVPGLKELRLAIQNWHPLRSGLNLDQIMITSGANHAMYTVLTTLFDIGDNVGIIEPYYFNYDMAVTMLGLKAKYFKTEAKNGFQLVASDLISWAQKEKVRGIILITPNNPTGVCYSSEEILKLVEWASKNSVEVIVDETYIAFDKDHLNTQALAKYIGQGLSIIGSFSKSFSLTGYRVGYWISGEKNLVEAGKVQDTLVICPSNIGQRAALHGLKACSADVEGKVKEMGALAAVLKERCKALKHFKLRSVGAYFAFLEHPFDNLDANQAALKLYEETGILSMPGTIFGSSQRAFLRLAFCNLSTEQLEKALAKLGAFDQNLSLGN